MAVIKSTQAATLIKDAIVLDLGDLERQAAKMRAAAETRAKEIIDEARRRGEAMTAGAHQLGFEQGRVQGFEEGLKQGQEKGRVEALEQFSVQLQQVQASWTAAAQEWDGQRQALERDIRQSILELAVCLGRKVTHRQIEVDPAVIIDQLTATLAHVLRPTDLTVRICAQDRSVLEAAMPQLMAQFPRFGHVHLVDDPAVARGGCVLSYGQGSIDSTVETQLRRLTEVLIPARGKESDNPAEPA